MRETFVQNRFGADDNCEATNCTGCSEIQSRASLGRRALFHGYETDTREVYLFTFCTDTIQVPRDVFPGRSISESGDVDWLP